MSSINPNNIDGTYPIAGQDNDSQGFRDNFTNIKNNFTFALAELTDLQNNAVLKSALSGATLDNNLNNAVLKGAQLIKTTLTKNDLGTTGGTVSVDWSTGHFQTLTTNSSVTLTFSNWPTSGFWASFMLEINVVNAAHTLTLPAAVSVNNTTIKGISSNIITFDQTGKHLFEFSTYDGGTTITIRDLTRNYDAAIDFSSLNVTGNLTAGLSRFASINSTPIGNATPASGAFTSLSTTGNVTVGGALVNTGYQISAPTANVAVTVASNKNTLLLTPTGTIVSFGANVSLPNVAVDGTVVSISSNVAVEQLAVTPPWLSTISPNSGNITLTAGNSVEYIYVLTDNKWYKIR